MMNFVGVDLAGSPKNATGFCVLSIDGTNKVVSTRVLHADSEIISNLNKLKGIVSIAIDAPLTFDGVNRKCDLELSDYGALPVTLRGMEVLAVRGTSLAERLREEGYTVLEVYAPASSKILGLYDKEDSIMQKNFLSASITGDVEKRLLSRDELDSISCALTAYLSSEGACESVGDEGGRITIPSV